MKILLLGADGQLGRAFLAQPLWCTFDGGALSRQQLDITDTAAVAEQFKLHQPDVVINCAAYTAVELAEQQPDLCYAVNTDAVRQLAQLCQLNNCLLVQLSTDYVFSGDSHIPYTEKDAPAPLNVYGKSKWLAEQAIQVNCSKFLIVRTSWLFSEFGRNFYSTVLEKLRSGQPVTVVDDQFGCPTYAGDLALRLMQLLQYYSVHGCLNYGVYHLSGTPAVSWYQFAQAIAASHNLQAKVAPTSTASWAANVKRPSYSVLDSSLFTADFNMPPPSWRAALLQLANRIKW
ncbi:dTDP-4-dehydrorhamnose reductase [Rheinheimera aquimaris]|uniref:dTDP-4-dehydrorhamnose reductase n=1 Tax=Rheinheimera aquimaris TaxID=412437 RepID=UPI000E911E59|nr:dTDP-4-dehydrorhamnose reductase [Rheinheimera sp.]